MLLLFTCKKKSIKFNKTFTYQYNLSFTSMAEFEIINSSFDSDSSDDLEHVYAEDDLENDEDKTESQQLNCTFLSQGRMTICPQRLFRTNKVKMLTILVIFRCVKLTSLE